MTRLKRDHATFGANLKRMRLSRGLSQAELAELCGMTQPNIAHFEAGSRAPCLRNLCVLADALDVTLDAMVKA